MSRIAYINGAYIASRDAVVSIEDRGYQLADGVYEVCEVFRGALIDEDRHLGRLDRSMAELRIEAPVKTAALKIILREILIRNRIANGYLYIQVTRGVAPRDHVFPQPPVPPSLVVTAKPIDPEKGEAAARKGVSVSDGAGPALEARRHQVHRAAAQCAGAAGGEGKRRL